jgi:hypothetical protein
MKTPAHTAPMALPQVLESRELLLRIDAALAPAGATSRGWVIADATAPALAWARVRVRPWLRDPGGMPGLRIERQREPLTPQELDPADGLALLTADPAAMPDTALALLRETLRQRRPHVCLFTGAGGELWRRQGGATGPLPPPRPAAAGARIRIALRGRDDVAFETALPATLLVNSSKPRDALRVQAPAAAGFAGGPESYEISSADGSPVGEVRLRLDFRAGEGADRLVITPEEDGGRVQLRSLGGPGRTLAALFARSAAVRLHLLFDCTTLDQDCWPRALRALSGMVEEEGPEERPQRKWNLDLRRRLAAGLQASAKQLHRRVIFDLWWFADVPRPDMAPPDGLPIAASAWGHPGERRLENLEQALLDGDFDYACGMDLFDAVDEALERVVARIRQLAREQHAVLVVGDSPPPPADDEDPLWRRLVDGSPRTNARRSPTFRVALAELGHAGVPLGWLFVRQPKSAGGFAAGLDHFPQFQTLREETLAALQQLGFPVEGCEGVGDLERSLSALFGRMKREPVAASHLTIREE